MRLVIGIGNPGRRDDGAPGLDVARTVLADQPSAPTRSLAGPLQPPRGVAAAGAVSGSPAA
jgi:hypothetical protein